MNVRRVTIRRDKLGEWRYRCQAGNWRTIAVSEEGFRQKRTILKRIATYWPYAEVVED